MKALERAGLRSAAVPADAAAAAVERLAALVAWHKGRFNAQVRPADLVDQVAFDAYTQGLLDGSQLAARNPDLAASIIAILGLE